MIRIPSDMERTVEIKTVYKSQTIARLFRGISRIPATFKKESFRVSFNLCNIS